MAGSIAVIGMAARFPGARDINQFWQNLRDGKETITFFTDAELIESGVDPEVLNDPAYVKASGVLEGFDLFDAQFFGFNPREAEMTDPQQRLFLEEAWKALEHGGYDPETYPHLIAVYGGVGMNSYLYNLYSNPGLIDLFGIFQTIIGNDKDFLSTRVSYKLNLKGPSLTVQSACSTSLVAVHMACQGLLYYQCDMALAGGVSVNASRRGGYFYQEGGILSPDGHCRAFDARAQGTVAGSGVGVVLLKRLEDALADGDTVHAIIKGSAINNDGSLKIGFTAPSVSGQAKVIASAQAVAGVEARSISYVEAHGTATPLGDPVEIAALTEAFRAGTDDKGFCAIGSVKTNIGHTDAAAGVAGLIKTVLALEHRELPPSLNFERPNPEIDFAGSPFYVNAALTEWKAGPTPRRAAVSSLGLGGTNAHVILEEAPRVASPHEPKPWQLLLLSAKTSAALEQATANLANHLKQHPELNLRDVAYTLQVGRRRFEHRRAVLCKGLEDGVAALETLDPKGTFTASATEGEAPPVVFMFPGGGAQHVRMGLELYESQPVFREQVDRCLELLKTELGCDLHPYLYPSEAGEQSAASEMERTSIALPLLFTVEYAMARLWIGWGIVPQAMIGHSLGEYVAACLSGVLSLEEALALVTLRGRLFEQLPEGAMLSVPLSEEEVRPLLGQELSLAAINGPMLSVVSGRTEKIEELRRHLDGEGVESSRLRISVAAHSEMVEPILKPFGDFAGRLRLKPPRIPYVSDVTGSWITQAEATDPTYWTRHLRQTVRFADGIGLLLREKECRLLEVGPGRTLSTLARQQAERSGAGRIFSSLPWPDDREPETASLLRALGQLWLAGKEVDWSGFYAPEQRRRVPLPTYPFEGRSYWIAPQKSSAGETAGQLSPRKRANVDDWFYLPSWKPTRQPAISSLSELGARKLSWLLFMDASGLGRKIAERLEGMNQTVCVVKAGERYERLGPNLYSLGAASAEDYERLIESLRAEGFVPRIILHLWSLTERADSGAQFFASAQQHGYYSLLFLAQALEKQETTENLDLVVITNHLHDVSGEEPTCPEKATLLGPCQVISQEHLNISTRCLDINLPATGTQREALLIDQLLAEALVKLPETVVAYRGPRRLAQSFERSRLDARGDSIRRLREKGSYLITGGWGSVGLVLAEYLARAFKARLILLGRSSLPERAQWEGWLATHGPVDRTSRMIQKVRELEALGAEVIWAQADVADEEQMRSALRLADERFGAVDGVVHAAGITSGKSVLHPIAEIGYEESELQFAPKVHGLYVLEKVLAGRRLDFCLLFSSNASVLGGLGTIAYSAANHFMDAFASARATDGQLSWISANWDAWPTEGFGPEQSRQRSIDEYGMTASESTRAFTSVVTQAPAGQVVVSTGDLAARINLWIGRQFLSHVEEVKDNFHSRPALETTYVAPQNETEQAIASIWQQLFGIERVGIHDDFFDLGGHSLLATRIVTRLRQTFRVQLPLRSLFDHPTVAGLALEVLRSLDETQEQKLVKATSPHAETAQELLARIDQLPDDQIDSLLDKYIS
jgi:acyl transferase domain-containing protein